MDERKMWNNCAMPIGPQYIVMRQVIGIREETKSIDLHVDIPRRKPSIEQLIDVFVKRLRITDVQIIPDKVIVRGDFEVKGIYVACLPDQPVHAVEVQRVRYSAGIDIPGARRWMDADANVAVEFVDYDCHFREIDSDRDSDDWDGEPEEELDEERGKKSPKPYYKPKQDEDEDDECGCHHHPKDDCDDEEDYGHHHHYPKNDCDEDQCGCGHHKHDDCDDDCHEKKCKPCCKKRCTRHFNVSVVLRITAKVMADRQVMVNPQYPGLPYNPKG